MFPDEADNILARDASASITRRGDYALCHRASKGLAWKVLVITPMAVINREILSFSLPLLFIFLLVLTALGVLVGGGLQRMVIRRIDRLGRKAEEITESGRLATTLDLRSR